jgi:prepilin-type processing-associated H-X9-DG protein
MGLILSAVQRVRATAARQACQNNLRQITLGIQQCQDTLHHYPPGVSFAYDHNRFPYLGWPAYILPWIEQQSIWLQIEQAFANDPDPLIFWGFPAQAELMATPIKLYACPSDPRVPGPQMTGGLVVTFTSYLGCEGTNQFQKDGLLYIDSQIRISEITDGTSNTIIVGERPPSSDFKLGWWYRGWGQNKEGSAEMVIGALEENTSEPSCPRGPYNFSPGKFDNNCDAFHFWSPHYGGAYFAFADGSVHFIQYSASEIVPALATRAGGEAVTSPD